jgi:hypothetical protein
VKIIACVLGVALFVGCTGSAGPAGPPGPAGATGATGATGPAGTAGTNGTNGKDGAQGIAGPEGDAGAGGAVLDSIFCNGGLSGATGYLFNYHAVQFDNGVVLASGGIADEAVETDSTAIYAPTQNGWQTAAVIVEHDAYAPVDGGWWTLTLDRSTLVVSIVYHDVDVAGGQLIWTLTPDKCIKTTY